MPVQGLKCRNVDARLPPDLATLRALLERGDARDRAFVDAMIRRGRARSNGAALCAELASLHEAVRATSLSAHAALRAQIAAGSLSRTALRRLFDDMPRLERDHLVEEVLGIAYPPLEEPEPVPELIAYAPSGYDEIVHALDVTGLQPGDRFLDIGSGLGKAVMLAALLTGAISSGVERDPNLHALAQSAARSLNLDNARFEQADALEMVMADVDVVFMYLPFTGTTLARVLRRLLEAGRARPARAGSRFLCSSALDLARYSELTPVGSPQSWLQVYGWR
jgi:protein-L-isoaspartate O-methyltransferase